MDEPFELYIAINRPTFYLKDLGVTARILAHWKENEIIPQTNLDGLAWNKFGFTEYIWIKIIQELRKFGMSIPMLRNVKKYLFDTIEFNLPDMTPEKISELKNQDLKHTNLSEEDKNKIIAFLSDTSVIAAIKGFNSFRNRLGTMIYTSIIYSKKIGILINSEGQIRDWYGIDQTSYETAYSQTELFISISNFIFDFMNDETKEKYLVPLNLMSPDEIKVLRAVRRNDLTEVIIKFPVQSGKKRLKIDTKMENGLSKEVQDKVVGLLNLKNYQSITLKNNSGQIYCERTHQKIV